MLCRALLLRSRGVLRMLCEGAASLEKIPLVDGALCAGGVRRV